MVVSDHPLVSSTQRSSPTVYISHRNSGHPTDRHKSMAKVFGKVKKPVIKSFYPLKLYKYG